MGSAFSIIISILNPVVRALDGVSDVCDTCTYDVDHVYNIIYSYSCTSMVNVNVIHTYLGHICITQLHSTPKCSIYSGKLSYWYKHHILFCALVGYMYVRTSGVP
jgi:hypothetical protein